MDWSIAHSLNSFMFHHDSLEDPLLAYVQASEALYFGMLVIVCALARHVRWAGVRRTAVHAGVSAGVGLLVVKIITEFYYRPRPFVAHPHAVHLFAAHVPDSSFPSDHATASVAIATAILLRRRWEWGAIAAVFAVLLCFGRVALGFHYPTDVLAGAAIGALSAIVLALHPLRDLLDALSDWVGALWDRATDVVVRALAPGRSG